MTDLRNHPMQYGYKNGQIMFEPGDDPEVDERYNRCPTCEEWSPCSVRKAQGGNGD